MKRVSTSVVLFLIFFSIYTFTMSGWIQYGDDVEKYRVAQSIVERQNFSFRPTVWRTFTGIGGGNYSIYELGQTVLQVPFYALGKVVYTFFPLPDINLITMLFVGLLHPILTALTGVVLFKTCLSLGFRYRTSLVLAIVFGLGTIAWPYSKSFTREPLLGLLILSTFYATYTFTKTNQARWLVGAGMATGYLVFTKFLQAMVVPFFVFYIVVVILQIQKQSKANTRNTVLAVMRGLVLFSFPAIIFLGLQILYAMARFGIFYRGIAGSMGNPLDDILAYLRVSQPGTMSTMILFSPEKSIFLYSPPAFLGLVACFKWFRQKTRETVLILGIFVITFISVIGRPYDGYGGSWWGSRYLVQITPLLIIPIGALLESASQNAKRFWNVVLGVLFAAGLFVQFVGAFSNDRDYLDTMDGIGTHLLGQIDFLRHGALDSLVLSLSPIGFPFQINPFGVVLLAVIVVSGAWIVAQLRSSDVPPTASPRHSIALLIIVLAIEFGALVTWIVAPYPQVLAAKGNTRFVAANNFLADGQSCRALAYYQMAVERDTNYVSPAAIQIERLWQRAPGKSVPLGNPALWIESSGEASFEMDDAVTITGNSTLRFSAPPGFDASIAITSDPVGVLPNAPYEFSGWLKSSSIYGTGYGVVSFFEDDGNWGKGRVTDVQAIDETSGWRLFRKTFTTLSTSQRLFIKAGLYKTFGTVWVDGIQLTQIDRNAPATSAPLPPCK